MRFRNCGNACLQPAGIRQAAGANVQLYAYRSPAEVKGLVLVEPQHEDETDRLDKVVQGKLKQVYAQQEEMEKACLAQAEKGFNVGSEELNQLPLR